MEDDLCLKTTFDGRRPFTEDDHWRPLTEEDLWRKTTFDGRLPLTKDDLYGRLPLIKDDLWRKTTFEGRRPLMEDNFWRKTTFNRVTVYYLKKYFWLLTLTAAAQLTLNRKSYQLSKPEIEFHVMEEMYAALCNCTCAEKTTFLGKDD